MNDDEVINTNCPETFVCEDYCEDKDFLGALTIQDDDTERNVDNNNEEALSTTSAYNTRKPKWWKQLSGKPTKAQRRCMAAMTAYKLDRPAYGESVDWGTVFTNHQPIWLELGFGNGDNLLALAQRHPEINFVGAEIHPPSLGKVFSRMYHGVQKRSFWTGYTEYTENDTTSTTVPTPEDSWSDDVVSNPYSNLRIYAGDGVKLLQSIPTASLSVVLVTFPDPFPKPHQKPWRLIQEATVREIHRVLVPLGRLYLATDHQGHYEYSRKIMASIQNTQGGSLFTLMDPCPHRSEFLPVVSKYELKGWSEGRKTWLSCWQANS